MSQNQNPYSFESSVEHLLHTNIAPTMQQCAWIPDILAQPRRDLTALDEEIQRIKRSLDKLVGKREILAADIDAHLALLSPVRHVPDDVLREIFISCLPPTHNATMSSRESPLLCHVSSRWRNIALSTPRLWSSLHVVISGGSGFQSMSSLVEWWLARSGALLLSLSVDIVLSTPSHFFSEDIANVSTLLDLLFAVTDRWESIDFTTLMNYTIDRLSQPLSALAPARLELGSTNDTSLWGAQRTLLILQRCANLEVCTLTITTTDLQFIPDGIQADLPHLTSLNIVCYDYTTAEFLFQRMRVPHPSLPNIDHKNSDTPESRHHWHFSSRHVAADALIRQALSPSLEILRISFVKGLWVEDDVLGIYDEILNALSSTALPVLSDITIHSGAPLRFLDLTFTRNMEEDILPALAIFISDGPVVSMKYEPVKSGPTHRPWDPVH
ncbi:hypothetical protein MVEN_02138700 [Mycena venus]|uniref:F-box domain-containing protein n=1 Tax=Mycena venus TaxID=2733690 RepID=A0A8H6XAK4_9AGAR|nr:hypothetical protein MVEN_02138700 [Mycena venus]